MDDLKAPVRCDCPHCDACPYPAEWIVLPEGPAICVPCSVCVDENDDRWQEGIGFRWIIDLYNEEVTL